jgi:nicotinamide phosphoribosyltransferase
MNHNPILTSDSYKYSHFEQYPAGTNHVYSYIEARGTNVPGVTEVVHFGLQKYIKDVLLTPISRKQVYEANDFCKAHGIPFNYEGWMRIVDVHGGFLPVTIYAVPEGTPVPLGNLMVRVANMDDQLPWLTSFIETDILRSVWYGSTVATMSREIKKVIKYWLDETSDNPDEELQFKLHDFGCRGVSSLESAAIGGAAHLVNFMGTDTVPGITMAMDYYNADICGYSIPASEHSTMTLRGREHEQESYQAMIDAYAAPGKIFACVSDSYDIYNAVANIWVKGGLLQQVKEKGATVVIRPDSGDPVQTPVDVIVLLMDLLKDEVTINSKGFRVLPDYVRVIQGDGIDIDDVKDILAKLYLAKISASNIAFGMGGGLLQKVNRDTFKFAMKASAALINGNLREVYKDPITDSGKKSKRGILDLFRYKDGSYKTLRHYNGEVDFDGMRFHDSDGVEVFMATRLVYESIHGKTRTNFINFDDVRKNAKV